MTVTPAGRSGGREGSAARTVGAGSATQLEVRCRATPVALHPLEAAPPPQAGQHAQPALTAGGYEYQLFVPPGVPEASQTDGATYPLMLFLHGSGERGSDVARVKVHGPPKLADRDPNFLSRRNLSHNMLRS